MGLVDEIYVFTGFASLQRAGQDSGVIVRVKWMGERGLCGTAGSLWKEMLIHLGGLFDFGGRPS